MALGDVAVIEVEGLDVLVAQLRELGYQTLGPVVRDGAIMLGEVAGADDFPRGWHDVQAPGSYRLERGEGRELFGWAVGPQSPRSVLFPPQAVVWRRKSAGGAEVPVRPPAEQPVAVVGSRPCELAAVAVLDRVLGERAAGDPAYVDRRAAMFVVAVECGEPSGTCFCVSMGTGPSAEEGYDLALTELAGTVAGAAPRYLVRVGSARGDAVLAAVPHRRAGEDDREARRQVLEAARSRMGRTLDTDDLPGLLARNIEHPRWDDVAERCLSCGNCTLVCPTCFCSSFVDTSALDGTCERTRMWASCFDVAHSFVHGGPVRPTTRSRYRQWMTHKLSTWHDQFGTSGCVGCGRCIAWCPVGIDITAEAAAIRASDGSPRADGEGGPGA